MNHDLNYKGPDLKHNKHSKGRRKKSLENIFHYLRRSNPQTVCLKARQTFLLMSFSTLLKITG